MSFLRSFFVFVGQALNLSMNFQGHKATTRYRSIADAWRERTRQAQAEVQWPAFRKRERLLGFENWLHFLRRSLRLHPSQPVPNRTVSDYLLLCDSFYK